MDIASRSNDLALDASALRRLAIAASASLRQCALMVIMGGGLCDGRSRCRLPHAVESARSVTSTGTFRRSENKMY
ncbi:hypothetical protein D7S86_15710 [Pararobbsia silviterrae]|uniref:Uncharacterized protein n=1 Tax=Pararobbsia silviterrae TaxID=1792498 RepID=A0A494XSY3_9BURK|nr:hypothetical protein D7S86_15710 [Pararobbsia silviterrae]